MSLLQDPKKIIKQIEWYISNKHLELFPGAFILASGNLSRQLLEQIIFILSFFGELPKNKYLKSNNELHNSGRILNALEEIKPSTNNTYLQFARSKGYRIRKFARFPRSLNKWRRIFNEPSHFSNPVLNQKIKEKDILSFINWMKSILDEADSHLTTAAVNELRSNGDIKAILSNDERNIPGIEIKSVITPKNIVFENQQLAIEGPKISVQVIPHNQKIPMRWKKRPILVQHSKNIRIQFKFVTDQGNAVDISSLQSVINAFLNEKDGDRKLRRRFKELDKEFEYDFS